MATLQKIRNKAGLLVAIIIGIALLAFVLSDFITKGSSLFNDSDNDVAEVFGNPVPYQYFMEKVRVMEDNWERMNKGATLDEQTRDAIRDQAWEELIREAIMAKQFETLGLSVTTDELSDIVQGDNIDPEVMQAQAFMNPQTGMFDKNLVIQYIQNLENFSDEDIASWIAFEDYLMKKRIQTKYNNLIRKGLYATTPQATLESAENNLKVTFSLVSENYETIPDSEIVISKQDMEDFYNKHLKDFEQEAVRSIEFISFDIIPSEKDFKSTETWINSIMAEMTTTDDIVQFVNYNSDNPFNDKFWKKGELPPQIDSLMFAADTGFVYGPYFTDDPISQTGTYQLAKLIRIEELPDSVKARHILIQPSETMPYQQAKVLADSLQKKLEAGADFGQLAMQNSADQGSAAKGGDVGWFSEGMMVKPFQDSCFFSETGEIKQTISQFGIHIVQVTEKGPESKKVQVAFIEKTVEPSNETYQNIYSVASRFAAENTSREKFDESILNNPEMKKNVAEMLSETTKEVPGVGPSREIIRWAFGAEMGSVSPIFELNNKFILAVVSEVREKGTAPLEQVETQIEFSVKKEKKGEILSKKLAELKQKAGNIENISAELGTNVTDVPDVSFSAMQLPMIGFEPVVIATAVNMEVGKLSDPIIGNNAVFLIQVSEKNETQEADLTSMQMRMMGSMQYRAENEVYAALKKKAEILDKRSKYF